MLPNPTNQRGSHPRGHIVVSSLIEKKYINNNNNNNNINDNKGRLYHDDNNIKILTRALTTVKRN